MPGEIEMAQCVLGQTRHAEARQDALEVAPVQDVEPAERQPAGADFLHRGLVFAAPRVGKFEPVERMTRAA